MVKIMEVESLYGDEYYTRAEDAETVAGLLIDRPMTIWCPFNDVGSVWKPILEAHGHTVIATNTDFFTTPVPEGVEAIVSNPPFSKKRAVVERIDELGLKYALILPMLWLNDGVPFDHGHQIVLFRKRMHFVHKTGNLKRPRTNCFVLSNGMLKNDFTIVMGGKKNDH